MVALLGRGGMGEVYRAEDLSVGQPVALKFLPESFAQYPKAIERFRSEVRIARQVSHPNVCRVYDLGEIQGRVFLSMEYVDGEDLGSLIRRIGCLPSAKAVEIARKLCAGLAAAHAKGVLHRDLKPANVMLDSRGEVLLTDFGIAGIVGEVEATDVRHGTPVYMAPEQLAGEEVTVRSDIYSLGLVLFEIFTGKLPFESPRTPAELLETRRTKAPVTPSTFTRDMDPAVERVILRCLDPNPAMRPSSALAVAAALPGGDPLAAALAAGETPSPEMVAAAGQGAVLAPRVAVAMLAAILSGLAAYFVLTSRRGAIEAIHPEYSADVLVHKAQDIIARLDYQRWIRADWGASFYWDRDYVHYAEGHAKKPVRGNEIFKTGPPALQFWYRQSRYEMLPAEIHDDLLTPGILTESDPPNIMLGMLLIRMDHRGRLLYLEAIPGQKEEPAPPKVKPVDWNVLFSLSGFDPAQFQPTEPLRTWLATSDTRAAWTGKWPGTDYPLRLEAASWRGRPVAFTTESPWTSFDRAPDASTSIQDTIQNSILLALVVVLLAGSVLLARKNLREGKGDRRGANWIALFMFTVQMVLWLLRCHMAADMGLFLALIMALATSVFYAAVMWTMYIAIEPFVRRRWPQTIISWTNVMTGRLRDPIVGRDVLFGCALGVILMLIFAAGSQNAELFSTNVLDGTRAMFGITVAAIPHGIRESFSFFFLLFLLRVLLRKPWLAVLAFATLWTVVQQLGNSNHYRFLMDFPVFFLIAVVVLRWGVLALASGIFVLSVVANIQVTTDTGAWFFPGDLFMLAVILLLILWAFRTSMGDQKLWKADLLS
jgi:serine/threonine-protein kinase